MPLYALCEALRTMLSLGVGEDCMFRMTNFHAIVDMLLVMMSCGLISLLILDNAWLYMRHMVIVSYVCAF